MASTSDFDRSEKVQRLRTLIAEHGTDAWDKAWQENNTPWDSGRSEPPLLEALRSPYAIYRESGRALVPGCGRGYDTIHIASQLRYNTLGIDVSSSAVEEAKLHLESVHQDIAKLVSFQEADFFTFTVGEKERFDVIYDYTFFCALPPELRKDWGAKMSDLTVPGGYLITLAYPIDGNREGGPPFSVSVDLYADALGPLWDKISDKLPDEGSLSHIGRERIVIWQKAVKGPGRNYQNL